MTSRIFVFDHFCRPIAEIGNIPTTPRSWVLNDYGRCEFSIGFDPRRSQSDQLLREKTFQYGNLILVRHIPSKDWLLRPNGQLPDWVGIILPPRNWDNGICHISAYSAECILAFRAMPYVQVKDTPRNSFQQMINIVHERANNIVFKIGVADDLPITFQDDLRTNAYDHIKKLVKDAGMDWDVTGEIDPKGNLQLFANLYRRKGIATSLSLSNTNTELGSPLLTEQGTPSNMVFGYSQANTAQSRFMQEAIHQASLDDYGPLQLNQVFVGRKDQASVSNASQTRAEERGRPKKMIRRVVLDKGHAFGALETGNTVRVKETNAGFNPGGGYGFEADVRILSMDYNDLSNKCPLNVEVL